jgi:hypothetical protein
MKSLPSRRKKTLVSLRKGLATFNSKKGQVVVYVPPLRHPNPLVTTVTKGKPTNDPRGSSKQKSSKLFA